MVTKEGQQTVSSPGAKRSAFTRTFTVRYVHKISPSEKDVGPNVTLALADLEDRKKIGAALRATGILIAGARAAGLRVDAASGRVVVFPTCPGLTTYWHSIILTPYKMFE